MLLSQIRLFEVNGVEDLIIPLWDASGAPRKLSVLFGGEGVGKTSVLSAIASTRPGHAVAMLKARSSGSPSAITEWILGDDDPARPHPLLITSPNAKIEGERDDSAILRRREQTLFERRASEGGFVLVAFSGARWFSRSPVVLSSPDRTLLRYDVRSSVNFDDATRADLTRDTKQVLSFTAIAAALSSRRGEGRVHPSPSHFEIVERSLAEVLSVLLEPSGIEYLGVDPARLEPMFSVSGNAVEFDDLPKSARHRIAFGALTLRALAAAYPDRNPREAEGVVLLDDLEIEQDRGAQRILPSLFCRALPRVQWIVTTSSPTVTLGCEATEVLALRKTSASGSVELHQGALATLH